MTFKRRHDIARKCRLCKKAIVFEKDAACDGCIAKAKTGEITDPKGVHKPKIIVLSTPRGEKSSYFENFYSDKQEVNVLQRVQDLGYEYNLKHLNDKPPPKG